MDEHLDKQRWMEHALEQIETGHRVQDGLTELKRESR